MSEQFIPLSSEDLLCDIPTIAENEAQRARKRQAELERTSKEQLSKAEPDKKKPSRVRQDKTEASKTQPSKTPTAAAKPDKASAAKAQPDKASVAKAQSDKASSVKVQPDQTKSAKTPADTSKPAAPIKKANPAATKKAETTVPIIDLPPVKQTDASAIVIDLPPVEQPADVAPSIDLSSIKIAMAKDTSSRQAAAPVPSKEDLSGVSSQRAARDRSSRQRSPRTNDPVKPQATDAEAITKAAPTAQSADQPISRRREPARTPIANAETPAKETPVTQTADRPVSRRREPARTPIANAETPAKETPVTQAADRPVSRRREPARTPVTNVETPATDRSASRRRSADHRATADQEQRAHTQPDSSQPTSQPTVRPRRSPARKPRKRSAGSIIFCFFRRTLLVIFTVVLLLFVALCLVLNLIFNGPSPAARDVLTMSLSEASGTKWVPGLFLGSEMVEQIRQGDAALFVDDEDPANLAPIEINTDTSLSANSDEWKDYPDGIRIENVSGDTYNAYVMIVRDPSAVYLATSTEKFSMDIPGTRITNQIETEGAIAAINAGAFFDNGTSDPSVGSVPQGLVVSGGEVVWNSGAAPEEGFVGFNQDNVLVVADSMTASEAMELGIRDGCCFGPVLIQNGAIKNEVYNSSSGYNPRTAIGQRADGAVIMLCIDGRQAGSLGGTYADIINIMVEYGAVNACNLDGGSSTIMLYRDQYGRYGEAGKVQMINNYSLLQEKPRKMPTFIMVRPSGEE